MCINISVDFNLQIIIIFTRECNTFNFKEDVKILLRAIRQVVSKNILTSTKIYFVSVQKWSIQDRVCVL